MKPAGTVVSEELTVIPAQNRVKRHIRAKYICRACTQFAVAAGEPSLPPESSYGSPEVLAHIAYQKLPFGLPFYRQEMTFRQSGLRFNRTTLANSMISAAGKLTLLLETMREHALGQNVLHADESVVLDYKRTASPPVVLFDYQKTRHGEHAKQFLTMDEKQVLGYRVIRGHKDA